MLKEQQNTQKIRFQLNTYEALNNYKGDKPKNTSRD